MSSFKEINVAQLDQFMAEITRMARCIFPRIVKDARKCKGICYQTFTYWDGQKRVHPVRGLTGIGSELASSRFPYFLKAHNKIHGRAGRVRTKLLRLEYARKLKSNQKMASEL